MIINSISFIIFFIIFLFVYFLFFKDNTKRQNLHALIKK